MEPKHAGFRLWRLRLLVALMVVPFLPGGISHDAPSASANPLLGAVLAGPFTPTGAPCATGNGRGMAFDGTNLYYTIVLGPTIYKIDTTGACLGAIDVPAGDRRDSAGGPLTWDGTHLWTVDYFSPTLTMYRVDPVTGATTASCSVSGVNPGHPALAGLSFPDGLHWTGIPGAELVLSGEISGIGRPTAVAFMSTDCRIASFFTSPPPLDGQWSGVAFDGANLWHSVPSGASVSQFRIEQTDLAGVLTGVRFPSARLQLEDLEFDPVTFAPKCALWGTTADTPTVAAYKIPCPVQASKDFRFTDVDFAACQLGTFLPTSGGNYLARVVLRPTDGRVLNTNPGQLYGVTTIQGLGGAQIDQLAFTDNFGIQFDVNPAKTPGGVNIIVVGPGPVCTDITNTPGVTTSIDNAGNSVTTSIDLVTATGSPLMASEQLMVYVKFEPAPNSRAPQGRPSRRPSVTPLAFPAVLLRLHLHLRQ